MADSINANEIAAELPDEVEVTFRRRWHGRIGSGTQRDYREYFEGDEAVLPRSLVSRLRDRDIVECDQPLTVQEYIDQQEHEDTRPKHLEPAASTPTYETKGAESTEEDEDDEPDTESDD